MPTQAEKSTLFRSLHIPGDPIILYNIWDAGSAKCVEKAGAHALATGSAPVALAQGYADGEQIPLALAIANVERILASSDLPLTMDLEGGYGVADETVAETISTAMATGIVGFNFEDQIVGGDGLHKADVQVGRIKAARTAADKNGAAGFINARTDIFLKAKPDTHSKEMLAEAINRAKAYEQAGADGFFAPGLADEAMIEQLCQSVALPVNIIALPHVPPKTKLIELGVARISYGPVPYRHAAKLIENDAKEAFA